MTEENENLKRVPLYAYHNDVRYQVGEALVDVEALKKKVEVELTGELTEVVATVFRSNGG